MGALLSRANRVSGPRPEPPPQAVPQVTSQASPSVGPLISRSRQLGAAVESSRGGDSFLGAAGAAVRTIPQTARIVGGAGIQALGDVLPGGDNVLTEFGKGMWAKGERRRAEIMPNVEPQSPAYYLYHIGTGFFDMVPAVAAGIGTLAVTKNPAAAARVGAGVQGLTFGARQYGESRNIRGRTGPQSAMDSAYVAATEFLTERIPLGILLKQSGNLVTRLAKAGIAEGIQEPLSESLQIAYELGVFKDDVTLSEATTRLIDAMVIGAGVGTSMSLALAPLQRAGAVPGEGEQEGVTPPTEEAPVTPVDDLPPTKPPTEEEISTVLDIEPNSLTPENLARIDAMARRLESDQAAAAKAEEGVSVVEESQASIAERPKGFFSQLVRSVETSDQVFTRAKNEGVPSGRWKQILAKMQATEDVKPEEILFTGVEEWLDKQTGNITQAQVLKYVKDNQIIVEENLEGAAASGAAPKLEFEKGPVEGTPDGYQVEVYEATDKDGKVIAIESVLDSPSGVPEFYLHRPGGNPLSEFTTIRRDPLNTLEEAVAVANEMNGSEGRFTQSQLPGPKENYSWAKLTVPQSAMRAGEPHTSQLHTEDLENVVVWVRWNERIDVDGNRVFFIEEIQSDLHQRGAETGYAGAKSKPIKWDVTPSSSPVALKFSRTDRAIVGIESMNNGKHVLDRGAGMRTVFDTFAEAEEFAQDIVDRKESRGVHADQRIPDAPFKKTWQNVAAKWAMLRAASEGFDKVGWTTGDQQQLRAIAREGRAGRRQQYDKKVRKAFEKLVPGRKVEAKKIELSGGQEVWSVDVNPNLKEFPQFSRKAPGTGRRGWNIPSNLLPHQREMARERLRKRLKELGLDVDNKVSLHFSDTLIAMADGEVAGGKFAKEYTVEDDTKVVLAVARRITVALEAGTDFDWVMNHEVIHALRSLNVISNKDWGILTRRVLKDKARMKGIRKRYPLSKKGMTPAKQIEEAVADMFADWVQAKGDTPSLIQRIFEKIKGFFTVVAEETAIMEDLSSGRATARAKREGFYDRPSDVGRTLSKKELEVLSPAQGSVVEEAQASLVPRPVSNAWESQTNRLINAWLQNPVGKRLAKLFMPFLNLGPQFKPLRSLFQGKIWRWNQIGVQMMEAFKGLTEAQTKAAFEYLTTANATLNGVPADRAVRIKRVKKIINGIGRKMVDRGMIESTAYADRYLPQIYLVRLLEERGGLSTRGRASPMGYTMQRKAELQENEYLREVVMGQVKDPGYLAARAVILPMRDMVIFDYLQKLAENPDWVLENSIVHFPQRDNDGNPTGKTKAVSSVWLKEAAARLRRVSSHLNDADAARANAYVAEMEAAAAPEVQQADLKNYRQIPNSPGYGALRGMWVKKEIYHDLVGSFGMIEDNASLLAKIFDEGGIGTKATQVWKGLKVAWNPPTIARNITSGMVAMYAYGDVDVHMVIPRMIQALQQMRSGGQAYAIARRGGVKSAGFASQEMGAIERDLLQHLNNDKLTQAQKITAMAKTVYSIGPEFYGNLESWLKTAVIIDQLAKSKKRGDVVGRVDSQVAQDAVAVANRAIFDYSEIGPNIRYLRSTPLLGPFVTFTYRNVPALARAVVKRPWRIAAAGAGLTMAAQMIAQSVSDMDDEEFESLRKNMAQWLQNESGVIFLPSRDKYGRWQPIDIGYILPWGGLVDATRDLVRGHIVDAAASVAVGGGPLTDLLVALKTNRDPFSDKPIWDDAVPANKKLESWLTWMWRFTAPSFFHDRGAALNIIKNISGKGIDPRTGEPKYTTPQALLQAIGIKVYPFDANTARQMNVERTQRLITEARYELTKIMRDQSLSDKAKRRDRDGQIAHIKVLQNDLKRYLEASKLPSRLQ